MRNAEHIKVTLPHYKCNHITALLNVPWDSPSLEGWSLLASLLLTPTHTAHYTSGSHQVPGGGHLCALVHAVFFTYGAHPRLRLSWSHLKRHLLWEVFRELSRWSWTRLLCASRAPCNPPCNWMDCLFTCCSFPTWHVLAHFHILGF